MPSYAIAIDLAPLLAVLDGQQADVLPRVGQALRAIAEEARGRWVEGVNDALPDWWPQERQQAARGSILIQQVSPYQLVVYSENRDVFQLETGRPRRDLKRMLDSSLKVRLSKDGKRYLYIPFRHNTPGHDALAKPMPADIHAIVSAADFAKSRVIGRGWRESGTGAYSVKTHNPVRIRTRQYVWGSRLPEGLTPKLKDHHATDIHAGMVRFDTSSGKQRSSAYLTFRTMHEDQKDPKWIVGPKPGLFIAQGIAKALQGPAERAVQEAFRRGG